MANLPILNRVFRCITSKSIHPTITRRSSTTEINHKDIIPNLNLINTKNASKNFDKSTAVVYNHPSIISPSESEILISDILQRTSRKRYQKGHWDSVISNYKEVEFYDEGLLSNVSRRVISRIRYFLERKHLTHYDSNNHDDGSNGNNIKWLPVHGIELKEDGYLKPHVDSIKFSGDIVAGLSLLSPSIMRLKKEDNNSSDDSGHHVDLLLLPLSLYVLSGESRYSYTHELLDSGSEFCSDLDGSSSVIQRGKRLSLIFRDTKED